jgi:hypothetical protein
MKANISDILLAPWITGVIITAIRLKIFSILSDRELSLQMRGHPKSSKTSH